MINVEARVIYYTLSNGNDNSSLDAFSFLAGALCYRGGCVVAMDGTTAFSNNSAGKYGGTNGYDETTWYVFPKQAWKVE